MHLCLRSFLLWEPALGCGHVRAPPSLTHTPPNTHPNPPPAVHLFLRSFLLWSVFQAVVMYVQNRYQRRRMYVRIALGRNTSMDVVAGETSGGSGQLLLLYPMLFVLQVWVRVARMGTRVVWVGRGVVGYRKAGSCL